MSTKYTVYYHGDGGQTCIPAEREFSTYQEAFAFSRERKNEKGHTCCNSVRIAATPFTNIIGGDKKNEQ